MPSPWLVSGTILPDDLMELLDQEGIRTVHGEAEAFYGESSLPRLYAVGALRQGHSQAIVSAGQGATAAIHINRQLLDL